MLVMTPLPLCMHVQVVKVGANREVETVEQEEPQVAEEELQAAQGEEETIEVQQEETVWVSNIRRYANLRRIDFLR